MHLETDGLGRRYGDDVRAVRNVSLDLGEGIHGLLGPNGAGKSTLMRLLTRVEDPTTETISWDGTDAVENPSAVRSVLGYLPQESGVYPDLTAREFIEYVAALRGVDGGTAADRVDELLALTNLEHVADRNLGSFSGGMRQRVGIPQAPVNDPDLLVVDEPPSASTPRSASGSGTSSRRRSRPRSTRRPRRNGALRPGRADPGDPVTRPAPRLPGQRAARSQRRRGRTDDDRAGYGLADPGRGPQRRRLS